MSSLIRHPTTPAKKKKKKKKSYREPWPVLRPPRSPPPPSLSGCGPARRLPARRCTNVGQWYKTHRAPITCVCIHVSSPGTGSPLPLLVRSSASSARLRRVYQLRLVEKFCHSWLRCSDVLSRSNVPDYRHLLPVITQSNICQATNSRRPAVNLRVVDFCRLKKTPKCPTSRLYWRRLIDESALTDHHAVCQSNLLNQPTQPWLR